MDIKITKKERKEATLGLSIPRGAEYLEVAVAEIGRISLYFSRYSTEEDWYLDSQFNDGWMPVFHHGEGSRSCKKQIAQGELLEAITKADFTEVESAN